MSFALNAGSSMEAARRDPGGAAGNRAGQRPGSLRS
ncbi:hypothetical protein BDSB_22670 [Burkholderia dolosa PC543]|nr:hypothetical protein BDSB_22670 [Burkholderia dolosa PC543]